MHIKIADPALCAVMTFQNLKKQGGTKTAKTFTTQSDPLFPETGMRTKCFRCMFMNERSDLQHGITRDIMLQTADYVCFASSSKDPNGYVVGGDYVVHMVIDGFGGRDISGSYAIPSQQEVVHLPGTKLRITAVKTANDGYPLIYAQELKENGKDLETNPGELGRKLRRWWQYDGKY